MPLRDDEAAFYDDMVQASYVRPEDFFAATAQRAREVLDAAEGWPTYNAGIAFQGLVMQVMEADAPATYPREEPMALYLIWGALTDEMDAPGRGSQEQDVAAVEHMKRAALEWLAVVETAEERAAYCDRWVHDECGYERKGAPRTPWLRRAWQQLRS